MTSTPATSRLCHQAWEYEPNTPGGIVVGVDGSRESIEALNAAATIARNKHRCLHAVTVIPPYPSYRITSGIDAGIEDVNKIRLGVKNAELATLMNALEPEEGWSHEVLVGRPARALADLAESRCAELLVLGRHQHGTLDRILGGETTLQTMRLSCVPVLAVGTKMSVPKTALAAIDFSPGSIAAAKEALALLGSSGTLYLAYVEPPAELLPEGFSLPSDDRFPGDIVVWFRRLVEQLGAHSGVLIETSVLTGRPVACILEFAERVGADLIAVGSHGHTRLERFLLGSVSTGLVRNAQCAVLVAPPRSRTLT
jgi:nucleotide-binding universal stress UspA family protein